MKTKLFGIWVKDVPDWMCHQNGQLFWTEYREIADAQLACIDIAIRNNYEVREIEKGKA